MLFYRHLSLFPIDLPAYHGDTYGMSFTREYIVCSLFLSLTETNNDNGSL
jgi:hypothetical protein